MIPRSHSFSLFSLTLTIVLSCFLAATAGGQEAQPNGIGEHSDSIRTGNMSDNPEDPEHLLQAIGERKTQKNSLFRVAPFEKIHEASDRGKEGLYKATHIKLGLALTHAFQVLSESPLAQDTIWGTATKMDFTGTWELVARGRPAQGQLFFLVEGRWEYGTTGPERLGNVSLGSLNGTANTFSAYSPFFILRNLYWQQGSQEAGWAYRIGKFSSDAMLSTSSYIASTITFLPTAGTGPFANGLTDSGLGIAAAWYINDRLKLLGIISDANANRANWGNIAAGDFYTAVEFAVKIAPKTPNAGYSKIALWHTDATENEQVVNGHLGPEGWGFFIKHEQELTSDGRLIGILRYGKSFNNSAVYEQQFGAHFLLKNPTGLTRLQHDLLGLAFNWAQAAVSSARAESNIEVFYRFPIFPQLDTTVSYQSIINSALDHNNNFASVFSLRLRTTF